MAKQLRQQAFWWVQGVTMARFPLAVAFAAGLTLGGTGGLSWPRAGWLLLCLLLAELSDLMDGQLARRWQVTSAWGAMFDPYIDSLSRLVVFWGLAQVGWVWAVLPLVMALRDVTVAYARLTLQRHGASVAARTSGKLKAWAQGMGALGAMLLGWLWQAADLWLHGISAAVLLVTAFSAVDYAVAAGRAAAAGR